ncbi:HMG box protein [Rhizophagus clarus]|uniref:HMG box protein n=1 Tax=Rhizophagus clarus TaxID=94130 RepID=A0A8H3L4R5_9GLOM|nr:HMG box protein [Rhizophagus clarus]
MTSRVSYNNNKRALVEINEHPFTSTTYINNQLIDNNTVMMNSQQQPLSQRSTKRRRNRDTPPRPLNSFMIYRREYQKKIKEQNPNILLSELSRISKSAADKWASEPQQVKQIYAEKARAEKERHMKLYPNYVYCPRRPSRIIPIILTQPQQCKFEASERISIH